MKKSEAFPSRFWKAVDLDEPVVLEIAFVTREKLENLEGKIEEKSVIQFTNHKRQLVLNATNWDAIVDLTGEVDTDDWGGKRIELFQDTTRVGGRTVKCIRVRAPQTEPMPKSSKPASRAESAAPKSKAKNSLAEDMDDTIPFE